MARDQHTAATWERKRGAHLSLAERGAIQALRSQGRSLRQIAAQLNCSPTTVMNELERGTPRKTGIRGPVPNYRAKLGQKTYQAHRKRCRKSPCLSQCGRFLEWLTEQVKRHTWSFDVCVGRAWRGGLFPEERIPCAKTLYFPAKR